MRRWLQGEVCSIRPMYVEQSRRKATAAAAKRFLYRWTRLFKFPEALFAQGYITPQLPQQILSVPYLLAHLRDPLSYLLLLLFKALDNLK